MRGPSKRLDGVLHLYKAGGFDAVAADDARFIRQVRGLGIPYVAPAVALVVRERIEAATAMRRLLRMGYGLSALEIS